MIGEHSALDLILGASFAVQLVMAARISDNCEELSRRGIDFYRAADLLGSCVNDGDGHDAKHALRFGRAQWVL